MRNPLFALVALAAAILPGVAHAQAENCLSLKPGRYVNAQGKPFQIDVDCRKLMITDLSRNQPYRIDLDGTSELPILQGNKVDEQLNLRMDGLTLSKSADSGSFGTQQVVRGYLSAELPLEKMARAKTSRSIRLKLRAPFRAILVNSDNYSTVMFGLYEGMELTDADVPLKGALKQAFLSGANTILGLIGRNVTDRVSEQLTYTDAK